jgi:hypothetical protein
MEKNLFDAPILECWGVLFDANTCAEEKLGLVEYKLIRLERYKRLKSLYEQIHTEYMIPNGITIIPPMG